MNIEEYNKQMKILSNFYFNKISKKFIEDAYDFLKDYKEKVFVKAIKNIVKKCKFVPTMSEIIEECDNVKNEYQRGLLLVMLDKGYFKSDEEYEKVKSWLENGVIPDWLRKDMNNLYKETLETI